MNDVKTKSQLTRARLIRERYQRWAPILSELAEDTKKLLDEASDDSLSEPARNQLQATVAATKKLLRVTAP